MPSALSFPTLKGEVCRAIGSKASGLTHHGVRKHCIDSGENGLAAYSSLLYEHQVLSPLQDPSRKSGILCKQDPSIFFFPLSPINRHGTP